MTPPFHITFSREINIFTAALLAINLLTFVFGGGAVYDKVSQTMAQAQQNREEIVLLEASIQDMKIIQQRHEDNIEQLYQEVYGTPKSKVDGKHTSWIPDTSDLGVFANIKLGTYATHTYAN